MAQVIAIAFTVDFAQKMRGWRDEQGLSQRELCKRVGIPQPSWSQYEAVEMIPEGFRSISKLIELTSGHPKFAITADDFAPEAIVKARRRADREKAARKRRNAA